MQGSAPSPVRGFYFKSYWIKFVNNFGSRDQDEGLP